MPSTTTLFEIPASKYAADNTHNAEIVGREWTQDAAIKHDDRARIVPLDRIRPNPNQPRRYFDPAAHANFAENIRKRGFLGNIVVRYVAGKMDMFEIVAGERRYHAAKAAGLEEIPVQIRDVAGSEQYELALLENIQRENLTLREECEAVVKIKEKHKLSVNELIPFLDKDRGWINNRLHGARLPDDVKPLLNYPDTLSHAFEIERVPSERIRARLVRRAIDGASLAQIKAEAAAYLPAKPPKVPQDAPTPETPETPVEPSQGVGMPVAAQTSGGAASNGIAINHSALDTPQSTADGNGEFLATERPNATQKTNAEILADLRRAIQFVTDARGADRDGEYIEEIDAAIRELHDTTAPVAI